MKSVVSIIILLAALIVCQAEEQEEIIPRLAPDVDLSGKHPEDYDWFSLIESDLTTTRQMMNAWSGVKYCRPRLTELISEWEAMLQKDQPGLKKFHELLDSWEASAKIEISWVSQSWQGGTQQKAEIPKAKLRTILHQIYLLNEMKEQSGLFNN